MGKDNRCSAGSALARSLDIFCMPAAEGGSAIDSGAERASMTEDLALEVGVPAWVVGVVGCLPGWLGACLGGWGHLPGWLG